MVITSQMEGRLRVKDDLLKFPSAVESLRRMLGGLKGVHEISSNLRTGSLLVIHDRMPSLQKKIMDTLALCLNSNDESPSLSQHSSASAALSGWFPVLPVMTPAERKRVFHFGLLGSFAATLLGAVLDMKKFHIVSGIGMVVLLGFHLADKKRLFLPKRRK